MGQTISPLSTYVYEAPHWTGLQSSSKQTYQSSSPKYSTLKTLVCCGDCSLKCTLTARHGLKWGRVARLRRNLVSGLGIINEQSSICIDRNEVDDQDDQIPARNEVGVKKSLNREMNLRKYSNLPVSYFEGPFVENDEETNNEILQNFCTSGKLRGASKLIDVMARLNQIPHFPSCINLIRGLIKQDHIDKAAAFLKIMVMSGGVPDIITCNMLIGGFCKTGHLKSAITLLGDMALCGCPPDVITYNTVIRSMFDHRRFDQAIEFWKSRLGNGCPPYIITSTVVIELVCRHCGAQRALEVLEDLSLQGCSPDIVTYNMLINYTCKRRDFENTALVMRDLLSSGLEPNTRTYNTLLHSLCSTGHWDEVEEILSVMNATSNPPTVVTYNILINGFCKYGDLDRAIDFYYQMVSRHRSPDTITYNTLLQAICREGMADFAVEIFNCISDTIPNLVTYNIIIDGLSKNCEIGKVLEFYGRMIRSGISPNGATKRSLVWGFCRCDRAEEAVKILKEMGKKNPRIGNSGYRLMVSKLCDHKKVDVAIEVLEMMMMSGSRVDEVIFSTLIRGLTDVGMREEAAEIHHKLIQWEVIREVSKGD